MDFPEKHSDYWYPEGASYRNVGRIPKIFSWIFYAKSMFVNMSRNRHLNFQKPRNTSKNISWIFNGSMLLFRFTYHCSLLIIHCWSWRSDPRWHSTWTRQPKRALPTYTPKLYGLSSLQVTIILPSDLLYLNRSRGRNLQLQAETCRPCRAGSRLLELPAGRGRPCPVICCRFERS